MADESAKAMKIAILTDAWRPQISGLVTTLANTVTCLHAQGHDVELVDPARLAAISGSRAVPAGVAGGRIRAGAEVGAPRPTVRHDRTLRRLLSQFQPDALHIATEGPLGLAGRRYCCRASIPFTSSFHTRFPEYVEQRCGVPSDLTYRYLRWFHRRSSAVLVPTEARREQLRARGFPRVVPWRRGVDHRLFRPAEGRAPVRIGEESLASLPRPLFVYAGRVSPDKDLEQFCALDLPGTRLLVGDGPDRRRLEAYYAGDSARARGSWVRFAGARSPAEIASIFAAADAFVSPSKSETFALTWIEALAAGLPIAAFDVPGPRDIVHDGYNGALGDELAEQALRCLAIDRANVVESSERWSWQAATEEFVSHLAPIPAAANSSLRVRVAAEPGTPVPEPV